MSDPASDLQALDRKVDRARAALQRSDESQPLLGRRIHHLLRLIERRDRILFAARPAPTADGRDRRGV